MLVDHFDRPPFEANLITEEGINDRKDGVINFPKHGIIFCLKNNGNKIVLDATAFRQCTNSQLEEIIRVVNISKYTIEEVKEAL